ncbi:MAG: helicase SNF2 [Kangiella sp.]|nr:MAG: helicase SNF2 [Kangiella sp.]
MLRFSKNELKNEFDAGAYSRGNSYFNQGRVGKVKCNVESKNSMTLSGEVAGSYKYNQNILVERESWGIDIEGDCSCPVSYNCKHVVAVLLEYLDNLPKENFNRQASTQFKANDVAKRVAKTYDSEIRIDDWFSQVSAENQKEVGHALVNQRKWIAYVLLPTSTQGEIEVELQMSGFKVKGGYLKPKLLSLNGQMQDIRYGYQSDTRNPIDNDIIRLLDSSQTSNNRFGYQYHSYNPTLQGELGWQALVKMLNTRRCFWRSMDNGYLSLSSKVPIDLHWMQSSSKDGKIHQLKIPSNDDTSLIFTQPVCQIDRSKNEIHPIQSRLTANQLKQVFDAPIVADKDLEDFNFNLVKSGLDNRIPLPLKTEIKNIESTDIIPKAIISRIIDPLDIHPAINCLKLSFLYSGNEIQLLDDEELVIKNEDHILRINRDLEKESVFLEDLIENNFEFCPPGIYESVPPTQMLAKMKKGIAPTETIARWKQFLETDRFDLEKKGWQIEVSPSFHLDFIHPLDEWEIDIEQENDWFSLKFDIRLNESDESKLPLLPIISELLTQYDLESIPEEVLFEHKPGQYIVLPKQKIMPILELMYELFDSVPMGNEVLKLSRFDALVVDKLANDEALNIQWSGDLRIKELAKKLADFKGIKQAIPAKAFKGELRDYQLNGLSWLQFLREFKFNGILADDMGLGKTVQTLAHIQKEKISRRMKTPCLIVAPTSLMSNWKREAANFTPHLKVLISQGNDRHKNWDEFEKYDIILSTYPLIMRDFDILSKIEFYIIVLDEAQNIKNAKSKTSRGIKALKSQHKLALTGTPMENHLGELWSVYDFLMPGFLGNYSSFNSKYRNPIEKDNNPLVSKILSKRVKPFLLRRTKQVVADELPPKTEIIKTVSFEPAQSLLYETIRLSMEKKIQQAIATKGLNRSHITILDALLKLRQVCCDPQLVKLEKARTVKQSAKMDLLMTLLPEMVEEGRKILIFSQFTSMLSIIEKAIIKEKISYTKLTGSTRKRDEVIEEFTSGKADIFLISLKAGGVGLNLTEADTVIHYDPWWNPAVENQASDRAHRIGQDKPVFVYKLIVENTLEEKILEMQAKKQALADGIYGDKISSDSSKLNAEDLQELLGITKKN